MKRNDSMRLPNQLPDDEGNTQMEMSKSSLSAICLAPRKNLQGLGRIKRPIVDVSGEQRLRKARSTHREIYDCPKFVGIRSSEEQLHQTTLQPVAEESIADSHKMFQKNASESKKRKLSNHSEDFIMVGPKSLPSNPGLPGEENSGRRHGEMLSRSSKKLRRKEISSRNGLEYSQAGVFGKAFGEDVLPSVSDKKNLLNNIFLFEAKGELLDRISLGKRKGFTKQQSGESRSSKVSKEQRLELVPSKKKESRKGQREKIGEHAVEKILLVNDLTESKQSIKRVDDFRKELNYQVISLESACSKSQREILREVNEETTSELPLRNEGITPGLEDKLNKTLKQGPHPPDLRERCMTLLDSASQHKNKMIASDLYRNGALAIEHGKNSYMPKPKIFRFSWDGETVQDAVLSERAILLQNLDPCMNSREIEAVLEMVLGTTCEVRICPPKNITCYKSGEAVVVFKNPDIADRVLRSMTDNLLVLSEYDRPIIASMLETIKEDDSFRGFFNLKNLGWKVNASADQKNSVATSHCAQTNTVEYDMGLHWRVLQERDVLMWVMLQEDKEKDLRRLRAKYL